MKNLTFGISKYKSVGSKMPLQLGPLGQAQTSQTLEETCLKKQKTK